jgi:hypothetical protein
MIMEPVRFRLIANKSILVSPSLLMWWDQQLEPSQMFHFTNEISRNPA